MRLEEGVPLTVVRAPMGFGKTTLVSSWLASRARADEALLWLQVRRGAGDTNRFWSAVARLLSEAGMAMPPHDPAVVAEHVAGVLTQSGPPVLVVLDNGENLEADLDGELLDLLRRSERLRLIVCLRSQRLFHSRSHIDLESVTITAPDLRFTAEETADLFTCVGAPVPADVAAGIQAQVGGWPEPTRGIALVLRDQPELTGSANQVATDVGIDFLRHRLLPELTTEATDFALATAIPESFTADLAAFLTADATAADRLELVEVHGILERTTVAGEQVYWWPAAARRVLAQELERRMPDQFRAINSRLAGWYLTHDRPEAALRHATTARDWRQVVAIIDAAWRKLLREHADTLRSALIAAPLDVLSTSVRALALRDMRLGTPDDWLLDHAHLPAEPGELARLGRDPDAHDVLDAGLAVSIALRRRGLFARAHRYGQQLAHIAAAAQAHHPDRILPLLPSLQLNIGIAAMLGNQTEHAAEHLEAAYESWPAGDSSYVARDAAGKLALHHAIAGDTRRADRWLYQHHIAPQFDGWIRDASAAPAVAARLLVAVDRLDLSTAEQVSETILDQLEPYEFWAHTLYAQSHHALVERDSHHMLGQIATARAKHRQWHTPDCAAVVLLAAAQADLLLAHGRGNEAHAVLDAAPTHPLIQVCRARLALLSGSTARALHLAADTFDPTMTPRTRTELFLVRACATHLVGDTNGAATAVGLALRATRATGTLRPYTTLPREQLSQLAAYTPELAELLNSPALRQQPEIFPASVTLITLTHRERLVLHHIAAGHTVGQTAAALYVSVNTIKTQLRSLYRKLGAATRADALTHARRWGLLPRTHVDDAAPEPREPSATASAQTEPVL